MVDNKFIIEEIKTKLELRLRERDELLQRVGELENRISDANLDNRANSPEANKTDTNKPATTVDGIENENEEVRESIDQIIAELDDCLTLLSQ
jgi:sugar-specific transcriptional regulator TrmB